MSEMIAMNDSLDKLIQISANNTSSITQISTVLNGQREELTVLRKELTEFKNWMVDNIPVDSADMKMIKRAVKAKVKSEVGYPSINYRKAIMQCYHHLEDHGKGSELGLTAKIAVPGIMEAIRNWHYVDYDS